MCGSGVEVCVWLAVRCVGGWLYGVCGVGAGNRVRCVPALGFGVDLPDVFAFLLSLW